MPAASRPRGLAALQTLVIIVAAPFLLVLIAMCLSLVKGLRDEPFDATVPPRLGSAPTWAIDG